MIAYERARFLIGRPLAKALIRCLLVLNAAALCGGVLAGCTLPSRMAGLSEAPVDPSSPVAQDVIRASRHPGPYPRFADIPATPTDLRPATGWRDAIQNMQQQQATLGAQIAALPPVAPDTSEAYAAETRGRLGPAPSEVAPPDARQQTEAEAQALRERATPPSPPR